jgi:hypothetical protein
MQNIGTGTINFQCKVLCLNTSIPLSIPKLPNRKADISSVLSGILRCPVLA